MKFLIEVVTTGLNFSSLKCGTEPLQMGEEGRGHMWCVSGISVNQKGVVRGISCPQASFLTGSPQPCAASNASRAILGEVPRVFSNGTKPCDTLEVNLFLVLGVSSTALTGNVARASIFI